MQLTNHPEQPPGRYIAVLATVSEVVGGNDYPVEETGVVSIAVRDPRETKRVTEAIIACLADRDQESVTL